MTKDYRHYWLGLALIAIPLSGALGFHRTSQVAQALLIAAGGLLVILVFFEIASRTTGAVATRKAYGFAQVILGADGRFSTSKAVVALWTVLLATALISLSALAWLVPGLTPTNVFGDEWNSLVLLLGGPFASAVIAKGVVSAKAGSDSGAKSVTAAASGSVVGADTVVDVKPSPANLVSNDSGEVDLVDTQYVIFSLVAIVYFVGATASRLHDVAVWLGHPAKAMPTGLLPTIPDAILGLTGLAAATYVGNKAVATQGLRVVGFSPHPALNNAPLDITLVNLPATATVGNVSVYFQTGPNPVPATAPTAVTARQVTVNAPAAGSYTVTIATGGFQAGPYPLTVT